MLFRSVHGCSPSWRSVKSPRVPLLLGSWAAGFHGCSCPLAVCRNASSVVPSAKKKGKGYSEVPTDEVKNDDVADELEGEDKDVDDNVEEEDVSGEGMVLRILVMFLCFSFIKGFGFFGALHFGSISWGISWGSTLALLDLNVSFKNKKQKLTLRGCLVRLSSWLLALAYKPKKHLNRCFWLLTFDLCFTMV